MYRNFTLKNGAKFLPPYNVIKSEKEKCYVEAEVTDISARVDVRKALTKSLERIDDLLQFSNCHQIDQPSFIFEIKVGFDGSTSNSMYRCKFSSDNSTDEYMFSVIFSPLSIKKNTQIIWENKNPGSSTLCRPLLLLFEKETDVLTRNEYEKILLATKDPIIFKNVFLYE